MPIYRSFQMRHQSVFALTWTYGMFEIGEFTIVSRDKTLFKNITYIKVIGSGWNSADIHYIYIPICVQNFSRIDALQEVNRHHQNIAADAKLLLTTVYILYSLEVMKREKWSNLPTSLLYYFQQFIYQQYVLLI